MPPRAPGLPRCIRFRLESWHQRLELCLPAPRSVRQVYHGQQNAYLVLIRRLSPESALSAGGRCLHRAKPLYKVSSNFHYYSSRGPERVSCTDIQLTHDPKIPLHRYTPDLKSGTFVHRLLATQAICQECLVFFTPRGDPPHFQSQCGRCSALDVLATIFGCAVSRTTPQPHDSDLL
jgi:hypothetical protein